MVVAVAVVRQRMDRVFGVRRFIRRHSRATRIGTGYYINRNISGFPGGSGGKRYSFVLWHEHSLTLAVAAAVVAVPVVVT